MTILRAILTTFSETVKYEINKRNDPKIISLIGKKKYKSPKLKKEIIVRTDGETCELFNKKSMKVITLSKQSKEIIDKCDGSSTLEEICKDIYHGILVNTFVEDSTIFLDELSKEGFLTWK